MKKALTESILPLGLAALAWWLMSVRADVQNSSLFGNPDERPPLTLADHSWTDAPPPEKKEFRKNDLIKILVSHQSSMVSEGEMDRKKKAHADMVLKDWILLDGLTAFPDPQSRGDPRISGKLDNKMRAESELSTRDSLKFTIAARVIDIRPNGNLILEAFQSIEVNEEVWDCSLLGEVDAKAVQPNNTVLSEDVANMRIRKRESGHVRDGYRRGLLLRWLDKWQLF